MNSNDMRWRNTVPQARRLLACLMVLGCLCLCSVPTEAVSAGGTTSLVLEISNGESLADLTDYASLETLELTFTGKNHEGTLDTLPHLPNLKKLTINAEENLEISSAVNGEGLTRNKDSIEYLHLNGVYVGPGPVEELRNLDALYLEGSENVDIDYSKLDVDTLDLSGMWSYTIPVFMSRNDCDGLEARGVNVVFDGSGSRKKAEKTWKWIEEKAEELDLDELGSEQEIVDAATAFVLDELTYDGNIADQLERNGDADPEDVGEFYRDGHLYPVMEKDTAICGNYSALLKALLIRSDVDCFYIVNSDHAWNLVEADNTVAYVDSTCLDNSGVESTVIRNGGGQFLTWYMEDTGDEHIRDIDGRESPHVFPEYIRAGGSAPVSELDGEEVLEDGKEILEDFGIPGVDSAEEGDGEPENTGSGLIPAAPLLGIILILSGSVVILLVVFRRRQGGSPGVPAPAAATVNDPFNAPGTPTHIQGILYWTRAGKKAVLKRGECRIGKGRENIDLMVASRAVSRNHAVIRRSGDGFWIYDTNSTNGTFVNGRRITDHGQLLRSGDRIRLADEELRFRLKTA